MAMTYTELHNEVKILLRLTDNNLSRAEFDVLLKSLKLDLDREKLPSLVANVSTPVSDILANRDDESNSGLMLNDYAEVIAVYDHRGTRIDLDVTQYTAVERYNESIDPYYTVSDGKITLYNETPLEVSGPNMGEPRIYILRVRRLYSKLNSGTDGTDDMILQRHERLLLAGMIWKVKQFQKLTPDMLQVPLTEYKDALKKAKQEDARYYNRQSIGRYF